MKTDTLLFIPGLGCDERLFQAQIEYFTLNFNCLTHVLKKSASLAAMTDEILNLSELPSTFTVIGQSLGGAIAQLLAEKIPDRVQKIILINTWCLDNFLQSERRATLAKSQLTLDDISNSEKMQHTLASCNRNATTITLLSAMRKSCGVQVYQNQLNAISSMPSLIEITSKIKCRTLIIQGSEDVVFPLYQGEALQQIISGSILKVIENCGHIAPLECPQKINQLMADFLQNI